MLWTLVLHGQQRWQRKEAMCCTFPSSGPSQCWGGREDVVWYSRALSVPLAGEGQLVAGRDITTGHSDPPLSSRRV